jgi:hypothetical protein
MKIHADYVRDDWEFMYRRLLAYKKKHGNTSVPQGFDADPPLANWVRTQRSCCEEKSRVDRLNAIGFEWEIQNPTRLWHTMYQRLVAYKKEHGTTHVPCKSDPQLERWVQTQRKNCKLKDRIEDLLNSIWFEWEPNTIILETKCGIMYQRLLAYKEKHGSTHVPRKSDLQLENWVQDQRRKCKLKDRIDLLNDIGFVWDATRRKNQCS